MKKILGWLILISIGVGLYVVMSLSIPEIYSFPVEGVFGWMIPVSRWLMVPFVLVMFFLALCAVSGLVLLICWCFNGDWKEVWKSSPFGGG
jgi:hypothetical protein